MKKKKTIIAIIIPIIIIAILIIAYTVYKFKVSNLKEFTYIPEIESTKIERFEPSKDGNFGNASYKVKGDYNTYLVNYKKQLEKDGWKISSEKEKSFLEAKKDEHVLRIQVVNTKGELTVLLWSK